MKNIKLRNILMSLFAAVFMFGCTDYVQNIDDPIDNVPDVILNTPADVRSLGIGVYNTWSLTWDEHALFMDGLSDAMAFTSDIRGATYVSYLAIDRALINGTYRLDDMNNSTATIFSQLGRLRLYADTLVSRINNRIEFKTKADSAARNEGLYYGYYFGAMARYMYGYCWGLSPDKPGGVINLSALISPSEMYAEAIKLLDKALGFANPLQARQINTLKARIYMIEGKFAEAKVAADLGLKKGNTSFDAKYNTVGTNQWYVWAGPGRTQFYAADRFGDYIYKDAAEEARIPLYKITGMGRVIIEADTVIAGVKYSKDKKAKRIYMEQGKYSEFGSPIKFLSWEENELMIAELNYRLSKDIEGGLKIINNIRAGYYLAPITQEILKSDYKDDFLELIYVERDKQLAFTGLRMMDQRRFDRWHLDPKNTWKHLPFPFGEKQGNKNLQ